MSLRRELAGELNIHGLGYVLKEKGEQDALVFFVAEAARQEALLKLRERRPDWRLEFYGPAPATEEPLAPRSGDPDPAGDTTAPAQPNSEVPPASVRPSRPLEDDDWAESFEEQNFDDGDEGRYWRERFKEQKEQKEWDEASEQPPHIQAHPARGRLRVRNRGSTWMNRIVSEEWATYGISQARNPVPLTC